MRIEVHPDQEVGRSRAVDLSVTVPWVRQDLALIFADQATPEQLGFTEKLEMQR